MKNNEIEIREKIKKLNKRIFAINQALIKAGGRLKESRDILIASLNNSVDKEIQNQRYKTLGTKAKCGIANKVLKDSLNDYMRAYSNVLQLEEDYRFYCADRQNLTEELRKVQNGLI